MSEIAGFEYDIFISYCHDDNYPTISDKGWVDQFHDRLENWLKRQRRFKQLTIWRDPELNGNTLFEKTIEDKINSSALFFVLHSKNYNYSDYCKKELDWFVQHNAQRFNGINAGEHSRIFHLLLNNFPFDTWPKQLKGTSGFVMHDAQDSASLGEFTEPNQSLFTEQLRKIVDATDSTLSHLIKNATPAELPTSASDKPIKIFLADTADNQATFRKRIIADLKQQGIEVIANSPPPPMNTLNTNSILNKYYKKLNYQYIYSVNTQGVKFKVKRLILTLANKSNWAFQERQNKLSGFLKNLIFRR